MATELPTYLPLAEAAQRYHLDRRTLTRLVDSGTIRAVRINGGIAVAEEDVRDAWVASRRDDLWERVKYLDGKPVAIGDQEVRSEL